MTYPKYVLSDGAILRMDDADQQALSVYRGDGKWEPYAEWNDYLHGTPVEESLVEKCLRDWDAVKT
jgi:hypothetical protein